MRKVLSSLAAAAATFALPMSALAGINQYGMMERGIEMNNFGMLWTHLLGVLVLAIWGIVGVLSAIWLWQHIHHK